ncbi:hypothetical protein [Polyangium sp. 6x1]|uniref:hypothetical protein n=1 Tax=Polyangium sp. 6x1 TaxID=3042689 RepID=UPI0024827313|nr:hypothetical protein [Polyangium sp. 6x1]MDI1443417.1 hypothetical protein [Polyangium sp. 6x1]
MRTPPTPSLPRFHRFRILTCVLLALAACTNRGYADHGMDVAPSPRAAISPAPELLRFDIMSGSIANHFYRRGPVAAHLLTTSGPVPRLLVAFPAGNAGIVLGFAPLAQPAAFDLAPLTTPGGVEEPDGMRGVTAHLIAHAPSLRVHHAMLAGIRFLRDEMGGGLGPGAPSLAHEIDPGPPLALRRIMLDGRRIELRIEPQEGTTLTLDKNEIVLRAGPDGDVHFLVTALQDEPPLAPFPVEDLVNTHAASDLQARRALSFLTYREKLLAGSWRFLTYFGRDTLLALYMLRPALEPPAIEAGLGSVLDRLAPDGDVAHEEAIGEYAVWLNEMAIPRPADLRAPVLDDKMIDDDFLLAPMAAAYLLDMPAGSARAEAFLARKTPSGVLYRDALRKNLALVLSRAAPFAAHPGPETLVALKPGLAVGNWRDSNQGLGGGHFPFDVNVALVPAALRAAARLYASDLLGPDPAAAGEARALADAWKGVERFFRVEIPAATARARVSEYAASVDLDGAPAVASIDAPIRFFALALDAAGKPIPVMHSDTAFALLFDEPSPEFLTLVAGELLRPFPAGLRTDVGMLVANPAYAGDPALAAMFTRADYHGTVVWSWQQAAMAAGLSRQLARKDLPAATREALLLAERALWEGIEAAHARRAEELWSWEPVGGKAALIPFGQARGHVDESNALQLWSTVYLALRPPPRP